MKFTILATAAAILGSASAAQQAIVINNCDATIYAQSYPQDGSAAGPLTAVKPGARFSENFRAGGSTIKIATTKTLTKPLFFGYSQSANPATAYYELSTKFGNPFADEHNILNPGEGCEKFDCKAGDKNCYSTAAKQKVLSCPEPVTLYAKVCA